MGTWTEVFSTRRKNLAFCRFKGGRWRERVALVTFRLDST